MEKVLQRRDEEDLRSRKFLHPSSYGKVRSECEQRMVADHLAAIHNECPVMVEHEHQQDLRNAFALLKVKKRTFQFIRRNNIFAFFFIAVVYSGRTCSSGIARYGSHQTTRSSCCCKFNRR